MYIILKKIYDLLPNFIKNNFIIRSLTNTKIINNLKHKYLKRNPNLWPSKLEITSIIGCTMMCTYCPQTALIKSYKKVDPNRKIKMNFNDFKKYLKSVPKEVDIHFSGYVEPFQNEYCMDMIEYVVLKGHTTKISTTLEGVSKSNLDRLFEIREKIELNFHLPSNDLVENIGLDKKNSAKREANLPLREEYLEIIKYAVLKFGKKYSGFHAFGTMHQDLFGIIDNSNKYFAKKINSRAQNLENMKEGEIKKISEKNKKSLRRNCSRIKQNVLLPSGQISTCCQDYGLKHILGDLSKNTWSEFYNSKKYQDAIFNGVDLCDVCYDGVTIDSKEFLETIKI